MKNYFNKSTWIKIGIVIKVAFDTIYVKSAYAMNIGFFTCSSIKEHFTSIVGLERNRCYNHHPPIKKQWILDLKGFGDSQFIQNIIITILNHEHFSHNMSIFNRNMLLGF